MTVGPIFLKIEELCPSTGDVQNISYLLASKIIAIYTEKEEDLYNVKIRVNGINKVFIIGFRDKGDSVILSAILVEQIKDLIRKGEGDVIEYDGIRISIDVNGYQFIETPDGDVV
jgi:hypothetical protein